MSKLNKKYGKPQKQHWTIEKYSGDFAVLNIEVFILRCLLLESTPSFSHEYCVVWKEQNKRNLYTYCTRKMNYTISQGTSGSFCYKIVSQRKVNNSKLRNPTEPYQRHFSRSLYFIISTELEIHMKTTLEHISSNHFLFL